MERNVNYACLDVFVYVSMCYKDGGRMEREGTEDDPISIFINKWNEREKESKNKMGNVWFWCWGRITQLKRKENGSTSCFYYILNERGKVDMA